MKKLLLINTICLLFISACKKDNTNNNVVVNTENKQITGTWYYQLYDVKYFDSNVAERYDDIATPQEIYSYPSYTFNSDFTATYNTTSFTYKITTTGGIDSLIFSGSSTLRFKIISISQDQLVLERSYPEQQEFLDGNGHIVYSTYAQSTGTFGRAMTSGK